MSRAWYIRLKWWIEARIGWTFCWGCRVPYRDWEDAYSCHMSHELPKFLEGWRRYP